MTDAADNVAGLYQRHARAWARDRGDRLRDGGWLDRFLALIPPAAAVLDIGCGSGKPIARHLIDRGYAVTGIDSSPEMIAMCREHAPGGDWQVADMRTLAVGRRFDGVLAWDSFFHLDCDAQRRMFAIFRDHAVQRAALMFTSGPAHGIALGEYAGETLFHASLAPDEYRALLAANGFQVVAHAAEDPACGGHTVWLAQRR
jgi:SAM-dependent methyltransferase